MAEELVKQGHAMWEENPEENQQRNVGPQLTKLPTESKEAASSGTKSKTVAGVTSGQNVTESADCRKMKSEAQDTGIRVPKYFSDEYDSEDGLEMG